MANFDFLRAKQKQLSWKFRLKDFLNGKESLTLEQVVSHRDCDLGKWLYSEGIEKYKIHAEIAELEKVKMRLHEIICNIVELKTKGESVRANDVYKKMEPITGRIIELLDAIRNKTLLAPPMEVQLKSVKNVRSVTPREREILQLIAEGYNNKEIGARLSISTRTVETHRQNLFRKFKVDNIVKLVRLALKKQIVD